METGLKVQIIFASLLALELLGLYMIIIRTVVNLEYAFNRIEAIIAREVQLAMRSKEQEKLTREKAQQNDLAKSKKNDLLLNIPFMERLSKEKKKDGHA
jgi:hypothetical protein